MHLSRLNRNGQVSIPAKIRKALRLKEGDQLGFVVEGNTVRMASVVTLPRDQLWFFTREIQKKVGAAQKQIDKKRGRSFSGTDPLIRWLKS